MTGIYLFGKDENGKQTPKEIEHLTEEELVENFINREPEEIIRFMFAMGQTIKEVEEFLESEGYVQEENWKDEDDEED